MRCSVVVAEAFSFHIMCLKMTARYATRQLLSSAVSCTTSPPNNPLPIVSHQIPQDVCMFWVLVVVEQSSFAYLIYPPDKSLFVNYCVALVSPE